MAWQGRINADLTSDEARKKAIGESPEKFIYPEGQTPEDLARILPEHAPAPVPAEGIVTQYGSDVFLQYLGTHPIRISPLGEVTILPPGSTSFTHPSTALDVSRTEKEGILRDKAAWKAQGWKLAQREKEGGGGRMPEWDHLALFSLTRDEASKIQFTPDVMKEVMRIVVDEARRPQKSGTEAHEQASKEMFLMPVHFDQDNVHLQAFINRIGWNPTAKRTYGVEKDTGAWDAMRANVNARLKAAGIPLTLYGEPSAVMSRKADMADAQATAKIIEEVGADVPPELTQGPTKERVFKLVDQPELEKYEADIAAELLEITRRQSLLAGALKQVQGAKALYIENATLKDQKAALESDLSETKATLEETGNELSKVSDELDGARSEIETLTEQVTAATAKIAEQVDQIETLEGEKVELKGDLDETRQQLAQTDAALEQERAGRAADVKKAAETEAALKSQVEEMTKALDDERQARKAEAEAAATALEQAQNATQDAKGELQAERDTFLDRARAWADEHVKSPLVAQIDTLKEELAEARRSFAAEMADAQRQFMSQIRELTASMRPQQAEPQAQPRQRQQWPSWAKKSFSELSSVERTAMEKALASEIEKGRQQQGLRLSDFHKLVNDRWREAEQAAASEQDAGMKPKKP